MALLNEDRDGPDDFLIANKYQGTIPGDCYMGYTGISVRSSENIAHAACNAPGRRKVFEARHTHPQPASVLLGMAKRFEAVRRHATLESGRGAKIDSTGLRQLDTRQRRVLELFDLTETITAKQVAELLGVKARTARNMCQRWCESGFLELAESSRKKRSYRLRQ